MVAPDDRIEPVIFHSPDGAVCETDDGGPFWALLKADLAYRMAAVNEAETGAVVHVAFAAAGNNDSGLRGLSPQEAIAAASAKWADLLADESDDGSQDGVRKDVLFGDGVSSIADVRVAPLLDSSWGQSWAGGGGLLQLLYAEQLCLRLRCHRRVSGDALPQVPEGIRCGEDL